MKVYPNPVSGILNIAFDKEITAISVYNLLGQEVLKSANASEGQIDVSSLNAGSYFVKVIAGNAVQTVKVIKQ